jgi:transposase
MQDPPESPAQPGDPQSHPKLTEEQHQQILDLKRAGYGTRQIARRVGVNRKTVQEALRKAGILEATQAGSPAAEHASKLDAHQAAIQEKAEQSLTVTRILREIQAQGYEGGRTILADLVRKIRGRSGQTKKVRRRFETGPGEETQVDWSPYRVQLGDTMRIVHAFCAVLHHSHKAHVRFYLDERQSTLLEAHCYAFEDFRGVTRRIVYDRMATVVLGQIKGGEPIWHPRFLDFAEHYGFEGFLCRISDPDRKGAVEKFFLYLQRDFVQAARFGSLEEMNERVRLWLKDVANSRVHGTTGVVPEEAWIAERDFLIRLPSAGFATFDEELRHVDEDSTLWIRGTPYTVPHALANSNVYVRLFAERFEVLGKVGDVAFARRYVDDCDKGKLQIDKRHYEGLPRRADHPALGPAHRLEEAFLVRFPTLADLVAGMKLRMKRLTHIHLRVLWRLCERYGETQFVPAATRAQEYRAYSAQVVRRILEQSSEPISEPVAPLSASAKAAALLLEVDSGSLDDYAHLDQVEEDDHDQHA